MSFDRKKNVESALNKNLAEKAIVSAALAWKEALDTKNEFHINITQDSLIESIQRYQKLYR